MTIRVHHIKKKCHGVGIKNRKKLKNRRQESHSQKKRMKHPENLRASRSGVSPKGETRAESPDAYLASPIQERERERPIPILLQRGCAARTLSPPQYTHSFTTRMLLERCPPRTVPIILQRGCLLERCPPTGTKFFIASRVCPKRFPHPKCQNSKFENSAPFGAEFRTF